MLESEYLLGRKNLIEDQDLENIDQKTVEKTVEKILVLIKANPHITQKQLIHETGLTRRGVEWNLKKLKKEGRLKRVGPAKGGYWEVIEKE